MSSRTVIELDSEGFIQAIEQAHGKLLRENFLSKFNNISVSTKTACEILNISYSTMGRYVKEGRITPIRGTKKFELTYILSIDIKKGKHHE